MSLALTAMHFARVKLADKPNLYLRSAHAAGLVATLPPAYYHPQATNQEVIATAWLYHCKMPYAELVPTFAPVVAGGVQMLGEVENVPAWVQTVQCAGLIAALTERPDRFHSVEVAAAVDVLTDAHPALLRIAREVA